MSSSFGTYVFAVALATLVPGASWLGAQESLAVSLKSVELAALVGAEKDRFVAAHSEARKAVGVEPLAWSDELSKVALNWLGAQKDSLIAEAKAGWKEKKIVLPQHRMDNKYGENVAGWAGSNAGRGKLPGAERAVTWWLEEKAAFDKLSAEGGYRFGDEEGKTETGGDGQKKPIVVGHYTAIVWKATTHLGAAKLTFKLADDRGVVRTFVAVVCNYDPAGNVAGEKPF